MTKPEELNHLAQIIEAHQSAVDRYTACSDAKWNAKMRTISADLDVTGKAVLAFLPTTTEGMRVKAEYMLSSKVFTEWDDFERSDIIRALTPPVDKSNNGENI